MNERRPAVGDRMACNAVLVCPDRTALLRRSHWVSHTAARLAK